MSPISKMFNYTNEGCITELSTDKTICSGILTNGIYVMNDDDGPSYFYRGDVNNLVKFGSYTKDYYVYRYVSGDDTYDFVSLEACKREYSSCSESNKVLKYKASDNVPMYWKIVRINGDGTIRMIYAGTTPDATGYDTGIGLSNFNEKYDENKYLGYTYDKLTTETNSGAKTEIDNWYSNVLEGTVYDSKIATGKFCSDSSGYTQFDTYSYNFASTIRNGLSSDLTVETASPTFKCSGEMDPNFGGSYNLKAGLLTADEAVAAGGQFLSGSANGYLGAYSPFWTMTPAGSTKYDGIYNFVVMNGAILPMYVSWDDFILCPVINLRADVVFKEGTDGSKERPYELVD